MRRYNPNFHELIDALRRPVELTARSGHSFNVEVVGVFAVKRPCHRKSHAVKHVLLIALLALLYGVECFRPN